MVIKVIKTQADYEAALAMIERLIEQDPELGTADADELELLTLVLKEYEATTYPIDTPDPIEAIRFRMEQQELSPRDLIPYIGSRSKVSEILSGKRPLTLSMIRALNKGLGIPAKVLLQEPSTIDGDESTINWERFPIREMIHRGLLDPQQVQSQGAETVIRNFFAPVGGPNALAAFYRRSQHIRAVRTMDLEALAVWRAYVVQQALANPPSVAYEQGRVTREFMRTVAQLSVLDDGPVAAQQFLHKNGVSLVIEPHFQHTYLDGAAIITTITRPVDGLTLPVIGLTLRHDRLDNFWFTLMHELAHIARHFDQEVEFFDDLDTGDQNDPREREADELAGEALIPEEVWRTSPASRVPSPPNVRRLATQLGIHPAIVAGRVRHNLNAYRQLNQLVGHGSVRSYFPSTKWS